MLVRAFQIQVGRDAASSGLCASTQYRGMGRAGIEPHVQRVAEFPVMVRIGAEQFRAGSRPNHASMPACSTRLATCSSNSGGARMQLAGLPVHEERHRHAPVALARDAPVGPVPDHRLEARLAPCREESGLFDCPARQIAQRYPPSLLRLSRVRAFCLHQLFGILGPGDRDVIHADEPLRRGTEDDRRLVPPAVRIAVLQLFDMQQLAAFAAARQS